MNPATSDPAAAGRSGAGTGSGTEAASETRKPKWSPERTRKFKQAAMVYLHFALLYECVTIAFAQHGETPTAFGPLPLWLLAGALVAALVFWGLWSWQNVWVARVVWAVQVWRLPSLMERAFLPDVEPTISSSFYLLAIIVIVVNMWMLARAAWDV